MLERSPVRIASLVRAGAWMAGAMLAAAVALPHPAAGQGNAGASDYRSDRVLVAFKATAPLAARSAAVARTGLQTDPTGASPYFVALKLGPQARAAAGNSDPVKSAITALRRDPAVRVAEPDYRVHALAIPNDPRFAEMQGLHNTGQSSGTPDADIDAPEAWDITPGSRSVTVAIIDTGVDYNHPDLRDNILRNARGEVMGFDFANNDADPTDDNDHGTHVAGTVGAVGNNGVGVTGVAQMVRLMPLKFLDSSGGGDLSDAIEAVDFARTNGARILNNSWGGGGFSRLLLEAVQRARDAGILFVAAAGNESANNDQVESFPANLNAFSSNVVSVAASSRRDVLGSFSNFGVNSVDLAAPGVDILSTTPGNTYSVFSGTSMATPHVSGAAALILSRLPALNMDQLKLRLLTTVDHPAGIRGLVRTGRLNARNALEEDGSPPGSPVELAGTHVCTSAVRLAWKASGDDGATGSASLYEMRFSRSPITAENFASATIAAGLPQPEVAGTVQSTLISGLEANTPYYFALRAVDNVGNPSSVVTADPVTTLAVNVVLADSGESAPLFSGPSPWALTSEQSVSPTRSYADSPGAPYSNSTNTALTLNAPVTASPSGTRLLFHARTDLEPGFDFLLVEGSGDGGRAWQELARLTGASGFKPYSLSLGLLGGSSIRVRFRLISDESVVGDGVWLDDIRLVAAPDPELRLSDNAEGAPRFAGEAPWSTTTETSASPTRSYTDSPRAAYTNRADLKLTQSAPVRLEGILPELAFQARTDLEPGFDFLQVEVSNDGGVTWQRVASLTGFQNWTSRTVSLASFYGQQVLVRFRLVSDASVTADGAYVDDVQIRGEALSPLGTPPPPPTIPNPPADLAATTPPAPDGKTQLRLAWTDRSDNETAFRLERSLNSGVFSQIAALPPNTTSFTDTGLTANTAYTYRIRAANGAGDSAFSNVAPGRTLADLPPGRITVTPTSLTFPTTRIGRTATKTVTVRNSGDGPLVVTIPVAAAPFRVLDLTVGPVITVAPRGSRRLTVQFAPTAARSFTGKVGLNSNDPARPSVDIAVSGRGR